MPTEREDCWVACRGPGYGGAHGALERAVKIPRRLLRSIRILLFDWASIGKPLAIGIRLSF
jgi:hypothetical protein